MRLLARHLFGDHFGIDLDGRNLFASSFSTFDAGDNPLQDQQQVVATVPIP
jgi:hypothetical protein